MFLAERAVLRPRLLGWSLAAAVQLPLLFLVAFLIHATLNWLPVLEVPHDEEAMALLLVMMVVFAGLVAVVDGGFRRAPAMPTPRRTAR